MECNFSFSFLICIFVNCIHLFKNVKLSLPLLLLALAAGCAGRRPAPAASAAPIPPEPVQYTYVVKASRPHLPTSYTQGLYFDEGSLWEGTGQYGGSVIQRLDPVTGRAEVLVRLPQSEFGEGIARVGDRIYQLTWQNNIAHIYDAQTFEKLRDVRYAGEGWGLTTDGEKLYLSDGSEHIWEVDPATFRRGRKITVTAAGSPVQFLNELEWIEGKIWANIYTTDQIVIIDPATGAVEGVVDLAGLLPEREITPATDVLNGIAYDAATGRIFVTGKNWSRLFEIEIVKK